MTRLIVAGSQQQGPSHLSIFQDEVNGVIDDLRKNHQELRQDFEALLRHLESKGVLEREGAVVPAIGGSFKVIRAESPPPLLSATGSTHAPKASPTLSPRATPNSSFRGIRKAGQVLSNWAARTRVPADATNGAQVETTGLLVPAHTSSSGSTPAHALVSCTQDPLRVPGSNRSMPSAPGTGGLGPIGLRGREDQDLYELAKPLLGRSLEAPADQKIRLQAIGYVLLKRKNSGDPDPADTWHGPGVPLCASVNAGHVGLTQALLRARADVGRVDDCGISPLHVAVYHGNLNICKLLLDFDADVQCRDIDGNTPLFYAPKAGVCKILLEKKADPCLVNFRGQTALHLAARAGFNEVLGWLSTRVARPVLDHRDSHGATAMSLTRHRSGMRPPLFRHGITAEYGGGGGVIAPSASSGRSLSPRREPHAQNGTPSPALALNQERDAQSQAALRSEGSSAASAAVATPTPVTPPEPAATPATIAALSSLQLASPTSTLVAGTSFSKAKEPPPSDIAEVAPKSASGPALGSAPAPAPAPSPAEGAGQAVSRGTGTGIQDMKQHLGGEEEEEEEE
eukprot:CAMPEP_0206574006 /NCGR_PEP_ID=MMETSP0325_2-20121206/29185_1 /ASSEMBLY_ACC=CAM_ASM_000347 /TAXON_ID=2866 /ORGANISM="Crypthecodinium cohnii, Strain Seligo" /LENGTH=568 /DNA_ID=CAMNT_0054078521 /DNA_START=32 /DNA_END=1735 /DNA_ORIENTATION=-